MKQVLKLCGVGLMLGPMIQLVLRSAGFVNPNAGWAELALIWGTMWLTGLTLWLLSRE